MKTKRRKEKDKSIIAEKRIKATTEMTTKNQLNFKCI